MTLTSLGDLVEDVLADQLQLDLLPDLLVGEALLLERRLVALLHLRLRRLLLAGGLP